MKKLLLLLAVIPMALFSQNNNVGIGTTNPDGSAALDVTSNNQGLLTPRMSEADRTSIVSPAQGLLVYQTDEAQGFYYYDGNIWIYLNAEGYVQGPFTGEEPTECGQEGWTQKADFGGTKRFAAIAFSLNGKAYVGLGEDNVGLKNDMWEYDPAANTWTQKASFGGVARKNATAFTLNGKAYVGTGMDAAFNRLNDMWEYNPATDSWTQKANFGGGLRERTTVFTLNGKAYVGLGIGVVFKNDLWEYNPTNDSWTQKANFGGTARYNASAFTLNGKGYVGLGNDGSNKKDFWEYDPVANSWAQKADFGGTARFGASAFTLNDMGYMGTGFNGLKQQDMWAYDQATNTWTQKANFGGWLREGAVAFVVDGTAYMGTGIAPGSNENDIWEYCSGSFSAGNWSEAYSWGDHSQEGYLKRVSGGRVEFTGTTDASGAAGTGVLEIGSTLRIDGNEIITNTDGTLYLQSDNNGDLEVDNATFFVDASSNAVGIGTSSPNAKLEVQGGRVLLDHSNDANGNTGSGVLEIDNTLRIDGNEIITNTNQKLALQFDNNGDLEVDGGTLLVDASANSVEIGGDLNVDNGVLFVDASSNSVGIGATPALARLQIGLPTSGSSLFSGYRMTYAGTGSYPAGTPTLSVYASGSIAGLTIYAHSDERIKQIEGISNGSSDLNTLMKLKVTDYSFIDKIEKGDRKQKKVIAQQVAEVYPQAVNNNLTEVIPDIFTNAELKNGWVELATDLKVGERVKIITDEYAEVYKVVEVENQKFKVEGLQSTVDSKLMAVFVYGREVDDFHTVDYEAIAMLNVSATQEQQRLIEQLQKANADLKAELNASTSSLEEMQAEMQAIKSMLMPSLSAK